MTEQEQDYTRSMGEDDTKRLANSGGQPKGLSVTSYLIAGGIIFTLLAIVRYVQ